MHKFSPQIYFRKRNVVFKKRGEKQWEKDFSYNPFRCYIKINVKSKSSVLGSSPKI